MAGRPLEQHLSHDPHRRRRRRAVSRESGQITAWQEYDRSARGRARRADRRHRCLPVQDDLAHHQCGVRRRRRCILCALHDLHPAQDVLAHKVDGTHDHRHLRRAWFDLGLGPRSARTHRAARNPEGLRDMEARVLRRGGHPHHGEQAEGSYGRARADAFGNPEVDCGAERPPASKGNPARRRLRPKED